MKEPMYFVITGNKEGDVYIIKETKASLLKQLNPSEHGDAGLVAADILETLPDDDIMDVKYWRAPFALIIKGEIVTPKAVKIVTRFEI